MNLKPFNLERALAGDPVVTRDGRKVLEIIKLSTDIEYPVIALLDKIKKPIPGFNYYSSLFIYGKDGKRPSLPSEEYAEDLFMAPIKKTYWINVYSGDPYQSKEEAEKSIFEIPVCYQYHSTVPIEIED